MTYAYIAKIKSAISIQLIKKNIAGFMRLSEHHNNKKNLHYYVCNYFPKIAINNLAFLLILQKLQQFLNLYLNKSCQVTHAYI